MNLFWYVYFHVKQIGFKGEKGNLNYKFTAVYRKDETTGAFKEQSKTIFESKVDGKQATILGNKAPGSIGFAPVSSRPMRPLPPASERASTEAKTPSPSTTGSQHNPEAARLELAQALESLRNNSHKLETRLEHIDQRSTVQNVLGPNDFSTAASSDISPTEPKPGLDAHAQIAPNMTSDSSTDVKRYMSLSFLNIHLESSVFFSSSQTSFYIIWCLHINE